MPGYQGKVAIIQSAAYNQHLDDPAFKSSRGNKLALELMELLLHRFDFSIGAGLYQLPKEVLRHDRLVAVVDPECEAHRLLSYELHAAKRLRQNLDIDGEEIILVQRIKIRREPTPSIYLVRLRLDGTITAFDDSHACF